MVNKIDRTDLLFRPAGIAAWQTRAMNPHSKIAARSRAGFDQ
jgi:hypothetical protein